MTETNKEICDHIRKYFVYKDGVITRKDRKNSNGSLDKDGYLIYKVKGRQIKAHRLVWFLCNGVFPDCEIDHINRNRRDNRIENLRLADRNVQAQNTIRLPNKDTGVRSNRKKRGIIMQKLINIQNKLKAPKGQFNKFGGYKYRSCEDILEAVKPILKEEGCALIIKDELVLIGEGDNERFYIKAVATLFDESGKELAQSSAFAREPLVKKGTDESQITGTASSYARKYALNGLFCIDDTKDSDTTNQGDGDSEIAQARQYIAKALGKLPPETDTSKYDGYKTETDLNKLRAIYKEINTLYLGGK